MYHLSDIAGLSYSSHVTRAGATRLTVIERGLRQNVQRVPPTCRKHPPATNGYCSSDQLFGHILRSAVTEVSAPSVESRELSAGRRSSMCRSGATRAQ